MIAGGSAVLLFFFMFIEWFDATSKKGEAIPSQYKDDLSYNAWEAFSFIDILLFLLIVIVIAVVVVRLLGVKLPPLPVPLGTIILGAGALATLLILFRLIFTPNLEFLGVSLKDTGNADINRSIGVFLGLLAAIGMTVGGFLSMQERGESIPGAPGPLGQGAGGGPLGGGQPAGGYAQQPVGGQPFGGQPAGGQPLGGPPAADPGATTAQPIGGAAAGAEQPTTAAAGPKADWDPDPQGQARLRYWDGTQWTDQPAD
ncbi:MAG: hypothetical protein QOJ07_2086 [Thermoleophilaceae bacterium]|nr:hypothetical protein [Thermoleophilaceae bacterium]